MAIDSAVLKGASEDVPELTLSGVVDHGNFSISDSGFRSAIHHFSGRDILLTFFFNQAMSILLGLMMSSPGP